MNGSGRALYGPRVAGLALCIASLSVACTPLRGGWDPKSLDSARAEWSTISGQRVGDLLPMLSLEGGEGVLRLCRWPSEGSIGVSLPKSADERERQLLERALVAWTNAVPSIGLVVSGAGKASIDVAFVDEVADATEVGTGITTTDCVVGVDTGAGDRVGAHRNGEIMRASILLRRRNLDSLTREHEMLDAEFLGAVLHELGHALGVSGHVASRGSIMTSETEIVRRRGARVLGGETFAAPTVEALYSLPLGQPVGRLEPRLGFEASLDALSAIARIEGWTGPFARAGGDRAIVFWRTESGAHVSLTVEAWRTAMRGERPVDWRFNARALVVLAAGEETGSSAAPDL